jgi:acetylornithine deacetylase
MDVVELVKELVAIDSVNPSLVPGAAGEAEIARFVADWARGEGLAVEVVADNAIVRSAGGAGPKLLLCGHLDTVGTAGMVDPLVPRIEGDRLDSAFISAAGIPSVLYGPGGEGAHAEVEWASIAETIACARTLTEVARKFCG